ncbi:FadR/GntR family transcriptional regulator [Lacisediminimonas profundi]|uniref:FadR/GntR family transcriptional regulator n=1 Tax=Lacisediminimonas profundi TaxID=2603856 RepID=UPI00124B6FF6|nr:FCD domain-containing protein [Lacisediminimonas profundi]
MKSSTDSATGLRQALLDKLRAGIWKSGDRLPPERELGETYGIGRTLVRRVLSELKEKGLITQTVGSGTYVSPDAAARLQSADGGMPTMHTSPAELMEVRVLLEPVMIDLVIRHGTTADFVHMEDCCARGESAQTLEEFEHWDGALHQAIADATHNNFVRSLFQMMNTVREQGDWGMLKKKSVTPERRQLYQREHRDLVAALKERDIDRARSLLTGHLLQVRRNMLGY